MSNYEYTSSSASGGATGFDVTKAIFNQADTNRDGSIDRNEFQQWVSGATGGAASGAAGGAAGGVGAGYSSSSYESSSYSSTGGVGGGFGLDAGLAGGAVGVDGGFAGASSFESSTVGLEGGASYQSSSTFESAAGGAGFDVAAVNQAASYTAETNAAWSRYGAEVTGAGLYVDANPQIIRRPAAGGVQTYTQNIKVRFLQPPPVPPPGVSDYFIFVFFYLLFLSPLNFHSHSSLKKFDHLNHLHPHLFASNNKLHPFHNLLHLFFVKNHHNHQLQ